GGTTHGSASGGPVCGASLSKTIACGTPGESGVTVVTTLVCFFTFAREAADAFSASGVPRALILRAKE
ncbi:MAG: hypothetical protein J0I29_15800, partial [Rhizobiales bacterium]|nr:hypothetical protein [Hyphomicrobiales bacterium]